MTGAADDKIGKRRAEEKIGKALLPVVPESSCSGSVAGRRRGFDKEVKTVLSAVSRNNS